MWRSGGTDGPIRVRFPALHNAIRQKPKFKIMSELSIMQNKLESMISKKAHDIGATIKKISETGMMIDDDIVQVKQMEFRDITRDGDKPKIEVIYPDHNGAVVSNSIHDNAFDQFGGKFGIPPGYLKKLAHGKTWERNVAAHTLSEFAGNVERDRMLLRNVNGQTRAAVSDRYRRFNSMKIFLTFLQAAQNTGSRLVDAHSGEIRDYMEVIYPEVIEFDTPLNGRNYAAVGARIGNSDFGKGALDLSPYLLMVTCLNGNTGRTLMHEIHMGGAIPETVEISNETIMKDTDAKASLVADAMKSVYNGDTKERLLDSVRKLSAEEVDIKKETERLPKLGLTKGEVELFEKMMLNNDPANNLQGAPTKWKMVNGLTAVARDSEPERKRDLEKIAGQLLGI